jgi:hypothetical protein
MSTDPREVLRRADDHRRQAKRAREAAGLMAPGVGLGVQIGTFRLDGVSLDRELVKAMAAAAVEYADHQDGVAADLESRVRVSR